jgi:hypothetical protein
MSIVLQGSTSGSVTLQEPAVAGTTVLTLPAVTGNILTDTSPKAGNVLQVLSTTKTDTFSSTATSFTDVTGLTVSITPTSSSSKILVILSIAGVNADTTGSTARIARNGTGIGVATSAGSRNAGGTGEMYSTTAGSVFLTYISTVLDSPATTSAITYSGQIIAGSGGSYTTYINRSLTDNNTNAYSRGASSITVMEIAG